MRTLRPWRRTAIGFLATVLVLLAAYQWWLVPRYTVPIFMYHYIGQGGGLSVTPENFERQMAFLHRHGYRVISLNALGAGLRRGETFPMGTVVITFDDGTRDNFEYAAPVLKRYGFPATIFIQTGRMAGAYDGSSLLSWEQTREMRDDGILFGSHTRRHAYVPELDEEGLELEIAGSYKDLTRELGPGEYFFSYPVGGFTPEGKEAVRRAGYAGAVTTNRGRDRFNRDVFELNRVKIKDSDRNPVLLWLKASGFFNILRTLQPPA